MSDGLMPIFAVVAGTFPLSRGVVAGEGDFKEG
jgi:hypothetical protein